MSPFLLNSQAVALGHKLSVLLVTDRRASKQFAQSLGKGNSGWPTSGTCTPTKPGYARRVSSLLLSILGQLATQQYAEKAVAQPEHYPLRPVQDETLEEILSKTS